MTETVGKQSEVNNTPPWERVWNEAAIKVKEVAASVDTTVQKVFKASTMPWNMDWGSSTRPVKKEAARAVPVPLKGMETEKKMIAAAQFTSEEIKARDVQMKSPENIAELKAEITKTKNPEAKKILTEELNKLLRK